MTAPRAEREFEVTGDPWPVVDAWAKRQGYEGGGDDTTRFYSKGKGFLVARRELQIGVTGGRVKLQAWVAADLPARIMSAFILPSEITVESGGAKGILPRKMGRGEVNDLLVAFGQQPIE
ncbi:MAG: hypothetical protein WD757_09105 [Actinomycetota bacterium]